MKINKAYCVEDGSMILMVHGQKKRCGDCGTLYKLPEKGWGIQMIGENLNG